MGNISLVRVGGVCAILSVVSGIMGRISFGNEWLASRGVDTLITGHWFDSLGGLLFMVAALGFYRALRQAGPLALIAVVASLTGGIFLFFHGFIRLGIAYELVAPGITDALSKTGWLAAGVGAVLVFFIGVPLFSFAILRTSVVPKWTGWLGVIATLGFCLMALLPLVFSMATPWFLSRVFLVWLLAMGVVLLRLKEPVAPDSVASVD
ncbi:MAG: hypothetical protein IH830_02610 [Planctomycetes bacterium]|nr:hypothetical protein [Planctomycetota bacterium]